MVQIGNQVTKLKILGNFCVLACMVDFCMPGHINLLDKGLYLYQQCFQEDLKCKMDSKNYPPRYHFNIADLKETHNFFTKARILNYHLRGGRIDTMTGEADINGKILIPILLGWCSYRLIHTYEGTLILLRTIMGIQSFLSILNSCTHKCVCLQQIMTILLLI